MKKLLFYKIMLFLASFGLISFLILFIYYIYDVWSKNKTSENLANSYSISFLYSDNPSYSTSINKYILDSKDTSSPFVIGIVKIDKLNLNYPILSEASDELLKIAPCRFAGPFPNNVGNLCIAGHNYLNNTFFAKINNLEYNDEIKIYDNNGNLTKYYVYDKKEIDSFDWSCTSQDTAGEKIITLMTCNNMNTSRIVIKAKEYIT